MDDEHVFASVVASYFVREGYQVDLAHDGPSAAAKRQRPDLVLLDLMLPGFDGMEALVRAHAEQAFSSALGASRSPSPQWCRS